MDRPDLELVWEFFGGSLRDRQGEQSTRCVVHEDARPSASVNLSEGLWFCQTCGQGGDVFELIKLKEGLDGAGFAAVVARAESIVGRSLGGVPRATTGGRPRPELRGRPWAPRFGGAKQAGRGSLSKGGS